MGIKFRDIALSIAGDIIYPSPAMLYSSITGCYIAAMLLQNNAFSNANLALRDGKITSESSGLSDSCYAKNLKTEVRQ